jgi:hypothetical protein
VSGPVLLFAILPCAFAQQPALASHAAEIEHHVEQLAPDTKISVIPYQGQEEYGRFVSRTGEGFTFHDVDSKVDVTMKYEAVKHLRDGYGGYNLIHHRHTDRRKSLIVGAVVGAALVGLVIAIAVSLSHS